MAPSVHRLDLHMCKATPVRTLKLTSSLLRIFYLVNANVRYSVYICGDKMHQPSLCLSIFSSDRNDDHYNVIQELTQVAARWNSIGSALRLKPDVLEKIGKQHIGDLTTCLTSTVTEWLRRNYNVKKFGEPTWQWLVKAVGDAAGGANTALAKEIAERHKAGGMSSSYAYFTVINCEHYHFCVCLTSIIHCRYFITQ